MGDEPTTDWEIFGSLFDYTTEPLNTAKPSMSRSSRHGCARLKGARNARSASKYRPAHTHIMRNLLAYTLWLLAVVHASNTIKILGIFPYDRKSHFIVFKVLLQELARRGHDVSVISHFPQDNPQKNYHDISLFIPKENKNRRQRSSTTLERSYWNVLKGGIFLTTSGKENCKVLVANKEVQNLVNGTENFDVILVEQFNSDCALGLAYKIGAPVVGITTHVLMPWHNKRFGIPYNPAYVSFRFLEGGTKPTLYQKVERTVFDIYFKTLYYITQRADQATLAKYYDDIPPLEDLAREIKFLLLNHHFVLTGSNLFPANVIEVGGFHVAKVKPLSGDLLNFVEEAEHGVIYISFGTTVKLSLMDLQKLKAILGVIEELPQRFIWRWSKETSINLEPFNQLCPKHKALLADKNKIYIRNWLPQVDILGHPKVLAFFSHAGMGGTTEAVHYGVPIVAMPIAGDQPANAAAIEESGFGVQQPVNNLTKDNLVANFKKVLEPEFRKKVKLRSKVWHDRPLSPMDTAIYWIEFAARNGNFNFRTPAADVPLYQYINLDIGLVFAVFATAVFLSFNALMSLCKETKKTFRKETKKLHNNTCINKKKNQ